MKFLLIAPFYLLTSTLSFASETPPIATWKSDAELGFISTSGNTETDSTNAKLNVSYEKNKWRHEGKLASFSSSTGSQKTADRVNIAEKSNYKITDHHYAFISIDYEADKFSGYEYRASEAIGYGYRILPSEATTLDLFIGPGARQSKLDDGTSEDESILKLGLNFLLKINKTSEFSESITSEIGDDTTITKSISALTSSVSDKLSLKLTYTIKDTSNVPPLVEETDTELSVSLVYNLL